MKKVLALLIAVAAIALAVTYLTGCTAQEQSEQQAAEQSASEAVEQTATEAQEAAEGMTEDAEQAASGAAEQAQETMTTEKEKAVTEAEQNPLLNPAALTATAPDSYKVKFETSKGDFIVEVQRHWAPRGADRFYNLVTSGYYNDCRFFRVISGFMVQFGISGDPQVSAAWRDAKIRDDTVTQANKRGYITYAMAGPHTRTTQVFINYVDNLRLDAQGFAPFGQVIEGMDVVDNLYAGYGEGAPRGSGPSQGRVMSEGNTYLNESFPELDFIRKATIVE